MKTLISSLSLICLLASCTDSHIALVRNINTGAIRQTWVKDSNKIGDTIRIAQDGKLITYTIAKHGI